MEAEIQSLHCVKLTWALCTFQLMQLVTLLKPLRNVFYFDEDVYFFSERTIYYELHILHFTLICVFTIRCITQKAFKE